MSSHIYGVQGRVVSVKSGEGVLSEIVVEVIKPLDTAVGYFPFETPGEKAEFWFDEPQSHFKHFDFAAGRVVEIYFGSIDWNGPEGGEPPAEKWGSNSRWVAQRDGGDFFNRNGNRVEEADLFPQR